MIPTQSFVGEAGAINQEQLPGIRRRESEGGEKDPNDSGEAGHPLFSGRSRHSGKGFWGAIVLSASRLEGHPYHRDAVVDGMHEQRSPERTGLVAGHRKEDAQQKDKGEFEQAVSDAKSRSTTMR